MATEFQKNQLLSALKDYKRKYVKKQYKDLDESATRIMVNSLLTKVLGYAELDEIKTEYNIKGEYADYVVQIQRKKHFVVEVKSIQLNLNEHHLRQSLSYAANEGIDWIILTNGRQIQIYRVIFAKPIDTRLVADFDFTNATPKDMKQFTGLLIAFSKTAILKGESEYLWKCQSALAIDNLAKIIYSEEVIRYMRKELKKSTGINFGPDELADSLKQIISESINLGDKARLKK